MRLIHLILAPFVASVVQSHSLAATAVPVPPGRWAVEYAKDVCVLSREGVAGEPGIAIRTAPFAIEHDLIVTRARDGQKDRWLMGKVRIGAQPTADERWISVAERGQPRQLIKTRISRDELALLEAEHLIGIAGDAQLDVVVRLPVLPKAMAALRACETDLARRWGVDPVEMASWARPAQTETDLSSLFWDSDRRKSVLLRTPVRALLEIDQRGAVTKCTITKSSRVSWVDIRVCETLGRDARFRPAVDSAGRAVAGKFVTPEISSILLAKRSH